MFSGKTTELQRRLRRASIASQLVVLIKYSGDDRFSEEDVVTHDGVVARSTVTANELFDERVVEAVRCANVIGIDEGQFFANLVAFAYKCASRGCTVIVAGLDTTFRGTPFLSITRLLPLSSRVDKLTSVCQRCGSDEGAFSERVVSVPPDRCATDGSAHPNMAFLGGAKEYQARCFNCFLPVMAQYLGKGACVAEDETKSVKGGEDEAKSE